MMSEVAVRRKKINQERLYCPSPPEHTSSLDVYAWQREVGDSTLHERGWVYQERLLRARTVSFARTRVFFECLERQRSEEYPSGLLYADDLEATGCHRRKLY